MSKMTEDDFVEENHNPLQKYFRMPGLHVKLPSNGAFCKVEPTATGDIPVYPMRGADELLLKSPDALMSGYAIEKLIESCVPAVRDVQALSMPDVDVLLLAIRAATFGEKMDMHATCPSCQTEHEFTCDIPSFFVNVASIPAENVVRLTDELLVYLRPYNFRNANRVAIETFNEARIVQALQGKDQPTVTKAVNEGIARIAALNSEMIADCILKVVTPEGTVTNKEHIAEFLTNVRREWSSQIDNKLKELNALGIDKRLPMTCSQCNHAWDIEVEFNAANFFAPGS